QAHAASSLSGTEPTIPHVAKGKPVSMAASQQVPVAASSRGRLLRWAITAVSAAALLGLLGIVLFIRTEYGTVRIDLDDPHATVLVDGDEISIEHLGEPIRLKVGPHKLIVKRGDVKVETRDFKVVRDQEQPLHITLLEKEPDTSSQWHG